ncbi:MAG: TetR/AcrR family transcriptional regulator [Deltaproteobacteria bacterium]|nr:TetR/AcrR family transcriptional regulator [Deltaproteobacteria bacterium]MBW2383735.1 TetR/AcrR family transcriptional regulator [Deltaproteobacteria bacterium]
MPTTRIQKRRRILAAAREVCSEKGFEATRMDEIASRAGVSKGTLYNFFPSKEDLFVDTVLSSYQDFDGLLPAVEDASAEPVRRIEALAESLAGGFDQISQQIQLAHQAWSVVLRSPGARDRLFGTLREIYAGYTEGLADILRAGIASGDFRTDLDVEVVTATWIATFDGLLYRAGFDDPAKIQLCSADGVRTCLGWILEGITAVSEATPTDTHAVTPPPLSVPLEEPPT